MRDHQFHALVDADLRILRTRPKYVPDFFVVGAPKAGTTAVFRWLQGHQEVFVPHIKEPSYFAYAGTSAVPLNGPFDPDYFNRITTDPNDYAALYASADGRLTGDVSPVYLVDQSVAAQIARARPDARIIIILRDPVERAFSQYLHHVRDGLEPATSFDAALDLEPTRRAEGWSWGHCYATHSHYADQIARYLNAFPRQQILFLEFSQLDAAPDDCWRKICLHLGIAPTPLVNNPRLNVTAGLASVSDRPAMTRALRHPGRVQRLVKRLIPQGFRKRLRTWLEGAGKPLPVLEEATRQRLARRYDTERAGISEQTGLSLDHWTRAT